MRRFTLAFMLLLLILLSGCSSGDYFGKVESPQGLDAFSKSLVQDVGFGESDVQEIYKSNLYEYLIFLNEGIISNRLQPSVLFIPYTNINGVTKELCDRGLVSNELDWLITVKADISKEGTILVNKGESTLEDYKEGIALDRGVVVMESVNPDKLGRLESSFIAHGLLLEEINCTPT